MFWILSDWRFCFMRNISTSKRKCLNMFAVIQFRCCLSLIKIKYIHYIEYALYMCKRFGWLKDCWYHHLCWIHFYLPLSFRVAQPYQCNVWLQIAPVPVPEVHTQKAKFMGPTWAHLGPVGPRWAPCWPHETCYEGRLTRHHMKHNQTNHDLPYYNDRLMLQLYRTPSKYSIHNNPCLWCFDSKR